MKKIFFFIIAMTAVCSLLAQTPEKFNYQAVVRNASGQLMANATVGVRVSILQGNATGSPVYVETQVVSTNTNGLMTLAIGDGIVQQGIFSDIEWGADIYFMKTEIDPAGGSNYGLTTTQQILSVPYALYAKEAGNGFDGDYNSLSNLPTLFSGDYNDLSNKPQLFSGDYNDLTNLPQIPQVPTSVSSFTNDAGYITMDSIPAIPTVPTNVSAFANDAGYLTSFTEQQVLTISHDTLFLTGGSYVKLPAGFDGDYNSLSNKPQLFDGDYNSLSNLPTLFSGDYNDLSNKPQLFSGDYNDLTNLPQIPQVPTNVSAFANDAGYITAANVQEAANIPTNISAFVNDAGYLTSFTEQQVLTISHDTLFLTGGSYVKLPAGFDGDYNSLSNKPQLFDGDYNSLSNLPTLFSGDYNDLSNKPQLFSGDYNDLTNLPQIPQVPTSVSSFTNDAGYITMDSIPAIPDVPTNVSAFANDAGYITAANVQEAANIPTNVSAFANDAGYLTSFTEQQVLTISHDTLFLTGGSYVKLPAGFDGDYNSLSNKPQLFDGDYNSLSNLPTLFSGDYNDLSNKPQLFSGDYNDLTNLPQIPQVPTSVSSFTNDAGYITMDSIPAIPTVPTNVSAFANDAGYITMQQLPAQPQGTAVGDLLYWNGTAWVVVPAGQQGQQLVMENGIPTWQTMEDNSIHYIRFDGNGGNGSMSVQLFPMGVAQTVSGNTFTRSGFIFTGWNTAADGTGTSYAKDAVIMLTGNMTLYAQWTTRVRVDLNAPCSGDSSTRQR